MPQRSITCILQLHVSYTHFYPQKSIHPFTWWLFFPDYQVFQAWRLAFSSVHSNLGVNAAFLLSSTVFSVWRLVFSTLHSHSAARVNTWKRKPSHWILWLSGRNIFRVKAWVLFPEDGMRINARVWKGNIDFLGLGREIARTSRRLVFPNRRVVKPTPGLSRITPGLVKTNPGLVITTPGLVL